MGEPREERALPSDANAEAGVLSAMIVDNGCIPIVMEDLDEASFHREAHKNIYRVIMNLFSNAMPIDILTVIDKLKENGTLEKSGGTPYISELADTVLSSDHVKHHVQIVKQNALRRKVIITSTSMIDELYRGRTIESASGYIKDIVTLTSETDKKVIPIKDICMESYKDMRDYYNNSDGKRIYLGWKHTDNIIGGFRPGNLIIIGARPSMGKTQYAINIAKNLSFKGKHVYIKSYEMSKVEIVNRLINMCLSGDRVFVEELQKPRKYMDIQLLESMYAEAIEIIGDLTIYIDDYTGDDVTRLYGRLMQAKAADKLDLVMIDYLQLMKFSPGIKDIRDHLSMTSRTLKLSAGELGVPVVALSQLNRDVEKRDNKRPRLSDLRESGTIEQDADSVFMLYRDDYYNKDTEYPNIIEVDVVKNRHGKIGIVNMIYRKDTGAMGEMDEY